MAISKRVKPDEKTVEAFIEGAPDAGSAKVGGVADTKKPAVYEKGVAKGNKRQISLTISPELLRRVDEAAKRSGQGRAAIINFAIFRALESDLFTK